MISDTVVAWTFLLASLWGAWFTYNGLRPMRRRSRLAVVSFFAGWLTTELALHHIAWQAIMTALFVWVGALHAWPGVAGLVITLASWAGLVTCFRGARVAEVVVEEALARGLGPAYRDAIPAEVHAAFAPGVDWRQILVPVPIWHPEVERVRDITFARVGRAELRLDVYRHRDRPSGAPVLLQVHGGAWMVGSKNEQGVPLMRHLAARGWVCASANYRLSPRATFPDHLVDVKQAMRWLREHGPAYGGDPDFLVITGGSAGGHLAALAALTANEPEYQPGFEHVDTTVAACISFYGVYDFVDRHGVWPHGGLQRVLERYVMKSPLADAHEAWDRASPIARVHAAAPPFFVIHGTHDTMVPVGDARRFTERLRALSDAPVVYAEIPGAQHAFEIFASLRTTFVIHGVERFLAWVYARHLAGRRSPGLVAGATD